SKGDVQAALAAWRELMSGLTAGSAEWYEARYHSLRLLWKADAPAAVEAMRQHVLLHPEFGPEPWGTKLRELQNSMQGGPPLPPIAPPAVPGNGAGAPGVPSGGPG